VIEAEWFIGQLQRYSPYATLVTDVETARTAFTFRLNLFNPPGSSYSLNVNFSYLEGTVEIRAMHQYSSSEVIRLETYTVLFTTSVYEGLP